MTTFFARYCFLIVSFLCALSAAQPSAAAPNIFTQDHVNNSGPAAFVGLGPNYGGIGHSLEYQFRIPNTPLVFTPFVGVGFKSGTDGAVFKYALGGNAELGHRHRLLLGCLYGPLSSRERDIVQSDTIRNNGNTDVTVIQYRDIEVLDGFDIFIGYKGMIPAGFSWTTTLGIGYTKGESGGRYTLLLAPVLAAGIGFKL
jgi:hypothetical protein